LNLWNRGAEEWFDRCQEQLVFAAVTGNNVTGDADGSCSVSAERCISRELPLRQMKSRVPWITEREAVVTASGRGAVASNGQADCWLVAAPTHLLIAKRVTQ
jgi:hypothetical protein